MVTLLEQKFENALILVYFNSNINLIEKIEVLHKSQVVDNILSLGYIMNTKKTLNEAFPTGNDVNLAYEYVNLKQEAYSLFLTENLTLNNLLDLGYQKKLK